MAERMLTYVSLLLPQMTTESITKVPNVVPYPGAHQYQQSEQAGIQADQVPPGLSQGSENNHLLSPFFQESKARTTFRKKLVQVFTIALNLRAELHAQIHETYKFSFLWFGQQFIDDKMEQVARKKGQEIQPRGVILCLSPVVKRRLRAKTLGGFGPLDVVAKAIVIAKA